MYELGVSTVTKRLETWKLVVPLHDNHGIDFDASLIESITSGIVSNFPGLTAISCIGHWKEGEQRYKDRNLELVIDTAPVDTAAAEKFFAAYKDDLAKHLNQSKIYLTKEQSKHEVITFDEFFTEIGLEVPPISANLEKRRIAEDAIAKADLLAKRMGYETTLLRRDESKRVVIWERRVCGIQLRSEFADHYPAEARLIAADRIDHFMEWTSRPTNAVVVGDWEFQKFILSKAPFTPLVPVVLPEDGAYRVKSYLSQKGQLISARRFVEEFTMAIVCGVMALRDEGYLPNEISISVGSDGSLQWTKGDRPGVLFVCPATIPDEPIQHEILRCVRTALDGIDKGSVPAVSVQQAKALHRYVFKRAAVRQVLRIAGV
jgi:hypothetical protein